MHGAAAARAALIELFVFDAIPHACDAIDLGRASARAGLGLHQLRYVLAAAEHGGFRRAARQLGVQQSAVSRRIHELEVRLGASIFERGPHGVRLTMAGEDFVRAAQGAMSDLDVAVDRATETARGAQGHLRIGVLAGLSSAALQTLLASLVAMDPDLKIDLVEGDADTVATALAQGRLDVGFLVAGPKQLEAHPAWRERLLVAGPADDPLMTASALHWSHLAQKRLMVAACIGEAARSLIARRPSKDAPELTIQSAAPASVVRLVALGQGYAIINEGGAPRVTGVVYRPLTRVFLTFKAVLGRRPEKPIIRRLRGLLPTQD